MTTHDTSVRTDRGFTLIEVLIVVVLLGILAAVVVFSVRGINDRGQSAACREDARTLAVAVESYFADTLSDAITGTGSGAEAVERTLRDAGFIRDFSEYWNITEEGLLSNVAPC